MDPDPTVLIDDLDAGDACRSWATVSSSGGRYVVALERNSRDEPWAIYDFHATDADIRALAAAADRAHVRGNPYGDTVTVEESTGRVIDFGR